MKILNLPVNSTSFGNVSFGILNELYERKYDDFILQYLNQPDLRSFNYRREDNNFINWLNEKSDNFLSRYKRDYHTMRLWHINGSESFVGDARTLYTFNESDSLTPVEVNILNSHNQIIVSCDYSRQVFEDSGVESLINVVPLGFDKSHFNNNLKRKVPSQVCSILINGKFEARKGHLKLIPLVLNKFANNPNYLINLAVYNIHLSPEDNNRILSQFFPKGKPYNVNIHPFYSTLSELNDLYSNIDIVLDGSYAETWSIPSFTCTALGKYSVVNNASGIKEWANENNSVLVNPSNKEPMKDNMFFSGEGNFNVGNWSVWDEDDFSAGIDKAIKLWKSNPINSEGLKLQEEFTWAKSVDKLLSVI